MSMNSLGTGEPMTLSTFCRFVAKPNSSAARVARIGSQRPKITAASAMKPAPAVISLLNATPEPRVKNAPPRPAIAPARETFQNRVRLTLMPTVSAACGCSPTARRRRPHRVLNSPNDTAATAMYMR